MTATNINVDQFLQVLSEIKSNRHQFVDIDFVVDDPKAGTYKLVIHPVNYQRSDTNQHPRQPQTRTEIRNPEISTDNNDIFDFFGL